MVEWGFNGNSEPDVRILNMCCLFIQNKYDNEHKFREIEAIKHDMKVNIGKIRYAIATVLSFVGLFKLPLKRGS